ncbi:MAG TPA: BlaI/MecI/CopY family transcriptional regulator [Bryobacteraceae bacterium]|nr:BlaI/MecI/CopY family transcriptional regulator [Bryobacteraceae bacterium]
MRKPAPPRDIPPPLELECLKALWKLGEASVKDVREDLATSRDLAYTTVMTLLDRLVKKGGASRRKTGRMFVYSPALPQDLLRGLAVKELVDSFFDGSQDELLSYLRGQTSVPAAGAAASDDRGLDTALL